MVLSHSRYRLGRYPGGDLSTRALLSPAVACAVALGVACLSPAALGAKLTRTTSDRGAVTFYAASWTEDGVPRTVEAPLPRAALRADQQAPLRFPEREAADAQAVAVRAWARTELPRGTDLTVRARRGEVAFSVAAPSRSDAKAALTEAQAVADAALRRFAASQGFTVDAERVVLPDHLHEVVDSAGPLAALASALADGLPEGDPRAFAVRALHFAQAIPYEQRAGGGDAGFRRPLSLLAENRGDCDGKTVLFLGLLRARFPTLPVAVVLVPGHAFAAVGLDPLHGERTLQHADQRYVVAEPVGPGQLDLGEPSKASKKGLRFGRADVRPAPLAR